MNKSLKSRQSKGNHSAIIDDIPIQPNVHSLTMVIYIQHKFHEIRSIIYLVMAEEGNKKIKFRQSKGNNSAITDDIPINFKCIISLWPYSSISFMKLNPLVT